jgi:hypothetical protein
MPGSSAVWPHPMGNLLGVLRRKVQQPSQLMGRKPARFAVGLDGRMLGLVKNGLHAAIVFCKCKLGIC